MGWAAAAWQHCQIRKKSKVIANYANLPDNAHTHTHTQLVRFFSIHVLLSTLQTKTKHAQNVSKSPHNPMNIF